MPDLSIEYRRACNDMDYFETIINGSTQKYTVYCNRGKWHCDCKSFQFRGKCKHVDEAGKKRCNWSEEYSDERVKRGNKCPKCGGDTFTYPIGV